MDKDITIRERATLLDSIDISETNKAFSGIHFICGRFPSEASKDIMKLLVANGTTQNEFKTIIDILRHNYDAQFASEKIKEVEE